MWRRAGTRDGSAVAESPASAAAAVEETKSSLHSYSSPKAYAAWWLDIAEDFVNLFTGGTEASKTNPFLTKNYAPVHEERFDRDLEVKGVLPAALNGEYVRNGPNPHFTPRNGYHWFDGDGMLHGLRIKNGKASYVNREVQTSRLQQEVAYGKPLFLKIGDIVGFTGLAKLMIFKLRESLRVIDTSRGAGTGNTALQYHAGRLLALHEGDHPYHIQILVDGQLETIGRYSYEGKLKHPFTAHPKLDPVTNELLFFGYDMEKQPYIQYSVAGPDGELKKTIPIYADAPLMRHDFAITENYAIFVDCPLVFDPKLIPKGTLPFRFDKEMGSKFGLLPRDAKSDAEMMWFKAPAGMIFHTVNAWEEGPIVKLYACQMDYFSLDTIMMGGVPKESWPRVHLFEFDTSSKSMEAKVTMVVDVHAEFPRVNENFLGRKHKYAYTAVFSEESEPKIIGAMKIDLDTHTNLGIVYYGEGLSGGEPVFVPDNKPGAAEDDGYLLTFVHDNNINKSFFYVLDAKTMDKEPVAVVPLPGRVPPGFHGIFVTEEQIASQRDQPAVY